MSTAAQIFSFARAALQTDDTDLTDELLYTFTNDAVERIIGLRQNWPHLYAEGTLAVVASDNVYALASASFNPQTYTTIESVWDDQGFGTALLQVEYQEAAGYWIGANQTESDTPSWFSVYGGNLYLWPIPSGTRTFRVSGYREPNEIDATTDTPDIPSRFHNAIKYGVVALAIGQTEDYEGASWWANMANQSASVALRDHFALPTNRPIQLHGRSNYPMWRYPDWVRNMVP